MVAKKFMDKGEGEVSRLPFENFLSHTAENFRRGTLQCFINIRYQNVYAYEGKITIYYRKNVVSWSRKTS